MNNGILQKLVRFVGVDLKRYNKALDDYRRLFITFREFTMIPEDLFVANLDLCSKFVHVPGDIVECGVWRGGMAAAISKIAGHRKKIHLFDSFEGLPPAKEIDGKAALQWQKNTDSTAYYNNCTADESFVINAMKKVNHLNYEIHKGWFEDTLATFNRNPICILRLDADWYDSIQICLKTLFPFLTEGGVVIIDDYYTWEGCAKAVHDFLSETKSSSQVHQWNNQIAYIVKHA